MKKANILYADPPWTYKNKKTGGSMNSGSVDQYNVMSLADLKNYPINDLVQDNCICFMWATSPMIIEGHELLNAWGFEYKAAIYWMKDGRLGMGYWIRNQVEILLIGIKGKVPAMRSSKRNCYMLFNKQHSKKPDFFRDLIHEETMKMFNRPVRLELFARKRVKGWQAIGDQLTK